MDLTQAALNDTTSAQPTAETNRRPAQRLTIDGRRFKELVRAGYIWLRANEATVNAYNVYPVPDGDTGTNMMHTMRAAWDAIATLDDANIGNMARAVSMGALRGSRGNSGIILSQLFRGLARSIDGKDVCDAHDVADALDEAAKTAYAGIAQPVEGTILTVARETALAARRAAESSHNMRALLDLAVAEAHASVQRTPSLLKILREAGVVDSGGYGLYLILDGMRRLVKGESIEVGAAGPESKATAGEAASFEGGYGYDVQYLIYARRGQQLDVNDIRAGIEAMGECPLVMGDEQVVKVHVHVPDPGVPLSFGAALGSLRDVVVEDMQAQSEAFLPGAGQAKTTDTDHTDEVEVGFVAVSAGDGIANVFKDIGARAVVSGGQTMNPSVQDLLDAIKRAKARNVILLPNNGNVILAAQQAANLSEVPSLVIPTRTVPQGVAAAIAFNFAKPTADNAEAMLRAAQRTTTCEITTATRDVTIGGITVQGGQTIGLVDDKLVYAAADLEEVVMFTLDMAGASEGELLTLFYGQELTGDDAEAMCEKIRARYPNAGVDVFAGNQPHYHYIIGVE